MGGAPSKGKGVLRLALLVETAQAGVGDWHQRLVTASATPRTPGLMCSPQYCTALLPPEGGLA